MLTLEMRYGCFSMFFASGKAGASRFPPGLPSRVTPGTGEGSMVTTEDDSPGRLTLMEPSPGLYVSRGGDNFSSTMLYFVYYFLFLNFMLVPTIGIFPVHIHLLVRSLKHCPICSGGSVSILHGVSLRKHRPDIARVQTRFMQNCRVA